MKFNGLKGEYEVVQGRCIECAMCDTDHFNAGGPKRIHPYESPEVRGAKLSACCSSCPRWPRDDKNRCGGLLLKIVKCCAGNSYEYKRKESYDKPIKDKGQGYPNSQGSHTS